MKRPVDTNQNAYQSLLLATGEIEKDAEERAKPWRTSKLPSIPNADPGKPALPRSLRSDGQR
jgi:hypothetical protein